MMLKLRMKLKQKLGAIHSHIKVLLFYKSQNIWYDFVLKDP